MTFTKTPPTTPGLYAWRRTPDKAIAFTEIIPNDCKWRNGTIHMKEAPMCEGEWCRLVPAEEVEKAWYEGVYLSELLRKEMDIEWNHSRAKQAAEGKE